jgi:hypothetical protein
VDEISEQILFRNIYVKKELEDNPKLKLGFGIAKQVGKALLEKYTGYDADDAKQQYQDLLDLASVSTDKVVVIDDVERIKEPLNIKELLGYVSRNFTEENSIKVILIMNEAELTKILDNPEIDYLSIKEKTIWQTVEFRVNYELIYKELANKYNKADSGFLLKNKELIAKLLKEYQVYNLRWVLYFFSIVLELKRYREDLFTDKYREVILNTVLILCIEYKRGKIIQDIDEDPPYYMIKSVETEIVFRSLIANDTSVEKNEFQKNAIYFSKTYFGGFKYHQKSL